MTYLLDTHVLLWFRASPDKLGAKCLRLLKNPKTKCAVSVVSALELAQLVHKNRVSLPQPVDEWLEESTRKFQCATTAITAVIATEAYRLPSEFHADPADRLLAATARIEQMTLITADQRILDCEAVSSLDARI